MENGIDCTKKCVMLAENEDHGVEIMRSDEFDNSGYLICTRLFPLQQLK